MKFRLSLLYLSGSQSLRGEYLETSARTTNLIYSSWASIGYTAFCVTAWFAQGKILTVDKLTPLLCLHVNSHQPQN